MAKIDINELGSELRYQAKRGGVQMVSKTIAHQIEHPLGHFLGEAVKDVLRQDTILGIGAMAPALGESVPMLFALGLTAAISAGLTQMDYYHTRKKITDVYKEELAAKLKKPVNKVSANDLDTLAKENHTFSEELHKAKRQRNYGIGLSFVASMASLAVVTLLLPAVIGMAGLAPLAQPMLSGIGGWGLAEWGALAVKAVVGLFAYSAAKTPLHWIGDKLFDLEEKTTHDLIVSIKRDREAGKIISREQVLSVFADANPALNMLIVSEYGERFEKLDLAAKQKATEELSKIVPLNQLTDDINSGKVNVGELAFAVEGKISGVEHKEGAPRYEKRGMWAKIRGALSFKPHPKVEVVSVSVQSPEAVAVAYAEEKSGSFVKRLGLTKTDVSLGYVERLDQQAANTPLSQTIH